MDRLVEVKDICVSYNNSKKILEKASLYINKNEIVGLVGESGSGKSTLLYVICGIKNVDYGEVSVYTDDIGIVLQNPQTALDPLKSIGYSLRESLVSFFKKKNLPRLSKKEMNHKIIKELEKVGISGSRINDYPYQFSGGEIQRICLSRVLIKNPKLLILDEATSMLDVLVQAKIMKLLLKLQLEYNLSYLIISHDMDLINLVCNRAYILENTHIRELFNKEGDRQ